MKKMLVTGGSVFASKFIAEYFAKRDFEVFVLNRNTKPQPKGTKLIEADRMNLGTALKSFSFDIVVDVSAYTKEDIENLLSAFVSPELCGKEKYFFISSSAVYPETNPQPFKESGPTGKNIIWKDYGVNKLQAEEYLLSKKSNVHILRPPYLYGPMNNVYREAFVFECAQKKRPFYIPNEGSMKLQFFYIEDLCKIIETIIKTESAPKILNVGNEECISILDWVKTCYEVAGEKLSIKNVPSNIEQRNYFPFYNYEYALDVTLQKGLLSATKNIRDGLKESFEWYKKNKDQVKQKNFLEYIDKNFA
ncbi:MAG: NAD-dependent epimerase/dehydratase family protein [Treponema sp.]|nr:NAD-dependent epimerase/dehydratase family protein [Treponema sp.]